MIYIYILDLLVLPVPLDQLVGLRLHFLGRARAVVGAHLLVPRAVVVHTFSCSRNFCSGFPLSARSSSRTFVATVRASLLMDCITHAQSESAGPKTIMGQAVATLGKPHFQDFSDTGAAKKLLTVGPSVATAWPHKMFGPADSL